MENQGDNERIRELKNEIIDKFDIKGFHVSQAIQSGIVSRYVNHLTETNFSEEVIRERISKFLNDVDKHVYFVSNQNDLNEDKNRITTIINAHSPEVFVISGMGSAAENAERLISETDNLNLKEYEREDYSAENRRIAFFHKRLR